MRRGRYVGEVELGHLRHRVEDRVELPAEALEPLLGQREARKLRDMKHLLSCNRHFLDPPKTIATARLAAPKPNAHRRRRPRLPTNASAARASPERKAERAREKEKARAPFGARGVFGSERKALGG